jgi:hypothetical protein
MPDFTLEPDEADIDRPERSRPVRLVSTGLSPTAEPPSTRRPTTAPHRAYAPCACCQALVLTGTTTTGTRVALDTHIATYVVDWDHGTPAPALHQSRGYPVHQCASQVLAGPQGETA